MIEINKIYNENCLDTMSRMHDEFIDLTVTSPPFDTLRMYKGFSFDFESVAKELYRVTKQGGVVIWNVNDEVIDGSESGTSFRQALYFKDIGFRLHDTMLYHKINWIPLNHQRYEQSFEYMFCLSKGKPKTFNPIMIPTVGNGHKRRYSTEVKDNYDAKQAVKPKKIDRVWVTKEEKIHSNIFSYAIGQVGSGHPAVFPDKLAEDQILSWSNVGDLVYDCFAGSGTVARMSLLNGRNYIGSEISSEYCGIIDKRLREPIDNIKIEEKMNGWLE